MQHGQKGASLPHLFSGGYAEGQSSAENDAPSELVEEEA